jgi:D-glycero-alpha-D-manno-heptose-7-phosphate kinase
MIITRTPFRVSFFGGGSDLPAFYARSPGAVLSTSIDRYMYLSAHPYFDGASTHLKYSSTELARTVGDLRHPIVRRVLQRLGIPGGVEITSTADVPAGTGLGSSSAFAVGLLHLMYVYAGRAANAARLAREACEIEIRDLGAPIGKQDQYASAFGGLNFIRFFPDDTVDVAALTITPECRAALQSSLLMFYTGEQRSASEMLEEQQKVLASDEGKFQAMIQMVEMASHARALLEEQRVDSFGRLLHQAWLLKQSLSARMSNPQIDAMYQAAREAGAWGGKLLGAGGGGFLLVAAPVEAHARIRAALGASKELPLRLDRGGSKVVYMSEES